MADLVLYDGVCGLCHRLVQFLLKRDAADRLRFASLQGNVAAGLLQRFDRDARRLDTLYVIAHYDEPNARLLSQSRAAIHVVASLGGLWTLVRLARLFPRPLADASYSFVAKRRYAWFGRLETCAVPSPSDRAKFLEDARGPA